MGAKSFRLKTKSLHNRPFHGFFNFLYRKSIDTIAKFESDTYVLSERRYSSTKLPNFTNVCMVGGTNLPLTIKKFVKFCDFEEVYLH